MAILRIRIRGGSGGARVVDDAGGGVVAVTREKCRIEVVSEWVRTSGDGSCVLYL